LLIPLINAAKNSEPSRFRRGIPSFLGNSGAKQQRKQASNNSGPRCILEERPRKSHSQQRTFPVVPKAQHDMPLWQISGRARAFTIDYGGNHE
jgi:hypothetical protein